jgi:hypothetical protein
VLYRSLLLQGLSNIARSCVVVEVGFRNSRPTPKVAEAARGLVSQTRFCRSIRAEILFSSTSNDRQQADSSAKVFRV